MWLSLIKIKYVEYYLAVEDSVVTHTLVGRNGLSLKYQVFWGVFLENTNSNKDVSFRIIIWGIIFDQNMPFMVIKCGYTL